MDKRKQVEDTLSQFVSAFEELDWKRFSSLFAHDEDIAVFFPLPEMPLPYRGWSAVSKAWKEVFQLEATERDFTLHVTDLAIQMYGSTAIATFLVNSSPPAIVHRRTLVFAKEEGQWVIVHLHGSNYDMQGI